ncbi:MAG: hypothetical protein QOH41_2494 [Blastocatellia bacterium]|jgi:hypothetical protein|nr:hypothetical protein [Blastocatellia bacterium]
MADTQFYPSLATLVPLGSIPPNLGFIQGALQDVFDNLYFRDLQVQKSKLGDAGFYQLSLVIYKRLGFEIPGTGGAALVLNPGYASVPTTEIPIALSYRWEIVKYIKGFDNASLTELPRLLFDAFVEISGADSAALLGELIDRFHGTVVDPMQAFVDAYNLDNLPTVLLTKLNDPDPAAVIEDLLGQLDEIQEVNVYELVFAAYLNLGTSVEDVFAQISAFFSKWVKDITVDDFKAFLLPHCSLAIKNINIALEFPRTVLIPVDEVVNSPTFDEALPEPHLSRLSCTVGSLQYSTDSGMQFTDGFTGISFTKSLLGNTGISLGFTNMKLDLSRTTNIPEATADGRPVDFIGVYVQQATIGLPKKWFKPLNPPSTGGPQIIGTNIIMGTGGFTGKIGFDAAGVVHTKLGNIEAGLTKFDLRFERNTITESNIAGWLTIPGFKDSSGADAHIDITAHIAEDGDFKVTATEKDGILVKIPSVLDFKIYMLEFGREDNRFFLGTSGTVTLTVLDNIPALTFDRPIAVELKKLLVWQDGEIEIQGGNIILPQALTLKIGPVKLSVTAISMGSYTRNGHKYKYFGFDGGLNVNPGGVEARANGVKVYWRTDAPWVSDAATYIKSLDIFVRVEGIAIDLIIPGGKSAADATVLIGGFLQVKEPADPPIAGSTAGTEYAGGISFKMPKAGIGGSAAMRLNPSVPNFIIDTELSISVPIPLGNTSLGIYGFRGMIGMRYVADRAYPPLGLAADAEWYEYYKKKVALSFKEGINIDKFAPRKGFAIGAGLTLGTLTDSGKAFSAKLFLLLSLPDALLLQGQAAIMSERVDLSPNDPPFFAFIAITKQSVEAAFGVNYKLPEDSGAILDLQAIIEMGFYFNDSSAWYINVGRDQPVSKRVTARLFTLFNAWSYLMLSAHGIKAGAGVTWDFNKGFGPIRIEAHAYLDTQGHISFKPKQIGAVILLGGSASVRVFKFKLGFSVSASLAAEAPQPFIVTGSVNVQVDLPKPFKKFSTTVTLDFTWTFNSNLNTLPVPVFNEADISEAAKAVNLATRERFNLNVPAGSASIGSALPPPPGPGWSGDFDDFVIPSDSTVDIEFKKPIAPAAGVTNIGITGMGYVHTELVPPQRGKSSQVQHQYVVEEVKIRSWNLTSHQWDDYDVYAALTPLQHASFVKPADLIGLKQGWWQLDQPDKINKLSLLSQTPLSYANDVAGPFIPENSGVTAEIIFCPETPIKEQCFVVDEFHDLKSLTADRRYTLEGVQLRVTGKDGQVTPCLNSFGLVKGLALKPESQLEIFFPEATGRVSLRLSTLADNVTVLYQQRRQISVNNSQQPVYGYATVKQEVLNAANLLKQVTYDALNTPINKLVIIAGDCKCLDGVPAIAPAIVAVQPGRPSVEPFAPALVAVEPGQPRGEPGAPRSDTLCGSLAAYLSNVCGEAQTQLNALQQQYDQLIAEANEYQLLAEQFQNNLCDPTLSTRYDEIVKALLAEAGTLQTEIKSLEALCNCCRKLRQREPGEPGPILLFEGSPPRGTVECNIDPKFDYQCMSFVFGFCWLPLPDQIFNNTIPSFSNLLGNNNAMVRAINNTIHPIWRPGTTYAVSIRTVDTVSAPGAPGPMSRYMHIGFCTKGPLGHSHQYRAEYKALVLQDRGDQYRLQSLKPYIDFSKSYPNADGNVLNAKPLFYVKPKLQLFYIHPYIYTMFGGQFDAYNGNPAVRSSIDVSILDPVDPMPSPTALPTDPGYVAPVSLLFVSNELGHSNLDVQLLHNMATQGTPCTGVGHDGIAPMGIQSNVTVDQLKPRKLYLAVFNANYNNNQKEIHRYNFQTSRYADFEEQVNSYRLKDRDGVFLRDAVYDDIAVTLDAARTAQLSALLSNNYPSGDPLEQEYADPFDRLMDGILRIGPIDPPAGTEFNIVRDSASGKAIGVLVCSDEPFNDPKVLAADIATTIVLSQPNTLPAALTTLHSKDRSKAFVGVASLDMVLNDLEFTFKYLEYNGASYVPASEVTASFFTSPPQESEVVQLGIGEAQ